jgi:hypothetical protein
MPYMGDTTDHAQEENQRLTRVLHSTTDGMVWATEFCNLFLVLDRRDGTTIDEGTMVGWFANAIEIGRSAGLEKSETDTHDG